MKVKKIFTHLGKRNQGHIDGMEMMSFREGKREADDQ